ncbi:MAG: hypothetical protein ACOX3Q_12690 [Clostridia bacterium]|nr:hypothetical protein [Clostridiaceae bacterium]
MKRQATALIPTCKGSSTRTASFCPADSVLYIHDNTIADSGKHKDLYARNASY